MLFAFLALLNLAIKSSQILETFKGLKHLEEVHINVLPNTDGNFIDKEILSITGEDMGKMFLIVEQEWSLKTC